MISLVQVQTTDPFDMSLVQEGDFLVAYHVNHLVPNTSFIPPTYSVGAWNGETAGTIVTRWFAYAATARATAAMISAGTVTLTEAGNVVESLDTLAVWRSDNPAKWIEAGSGTFLSGSAYGGPTDFPTSLHFNFAPTDTGGFADVTFYGSTVIGWWAAATFSSTSSGSATLPGGWTWAPLSVVSYDDGGTTRFLHHGIVTRIQAANTIPKAATDKITTSVVISNIGNNATSAINVLTEVNRPPPPLDPGVPVCADSVAVPTVITAGTNGTVAIEIPSPGSSEDVHLSVWVEIDDVIDIYLELESPDSVLASVFFTNAHGADVGAGTLQAQRVHFFDAATGDPYDGFTPGAFGEYPPDAGTFFSAFGDTTEREGTWLLRVFNFGATSLTIQAASLCFGAEPEDEGGGPSSFTRNVVDSISLSEALFAFPHHGITGSTGSSTASGSSGSGILGPRGGDPHEIAIRLSSLDGAWETVGADRLVGIIPEHVHLASNAWGSDTASFELRRTGGAIHPDLTAFTPCEIEIAGVLCWSGRVKETPAREGVDAVISVQCEGWQYHLDDDQYERFYVHTQLSDFRDARSFLNAILVNPGGFIASGNVSADGGISMGFPRDAVVGDESKVGVLLDFGPNSYNWPKRVVLEWQSSNNDANFVFLARVADDAALTNQSVGNEIGIALNGGASGTSGVTFTTPRRYLGYWVEDTAGGHTVGTTDVWFKIMHSLVVVDEAYETGSASILKADQVIKDALDRATLLLDSDQSGIEPGTFSIPEFALTGPQSPREVWQAVNAFENYETKIEDKRPIYRPRASAPKHEIGQWYGAGLEDASANSGDETFNRALVTGQDAAGSSITVERNTPGGEDFGIPQVPNPSATVNASGWTVNFGALNRDTGTFDSSPASFQLVNDGFAGGGQVVVTVSHVLKKGIRHLAKLAIRHVAATSRIVIKISTSGTGVVEHIESAGTYSAPVNTWRTLTFNWTQPIDATAYAIVITAESATPSVPILNFDSVAVARVIPTLIDRRGFRRSRILPIRNSITQASAERIGDLFLEQHKTTPFRGSFGAVGQAGVRRVLGGATVHPAHLLNDTGQLVRCSHVIDPDTGGIGRDGRIANVSYDHDALTASVTLDNTRSGFEALLERLAVVVGSG